MTTIARRLSTGLLLSACGLAITGCSGGPTYGTGTSQAQQLFDDIDNIVTLGSTNRQEISYAPRPELVRPASIGALPPPRPANAAANDPRWPQSPEMIRARNIAAAESTRGDGLLPPDYNPRQSGGNPRAVGASPTSEREQNANWMNPQELRRHRSSASEQQAQVRGTPTQRRYLSEPPVNYRQPASTAPAGDVGVDEDVKQRRSEGTRSLGSRIRQAMPF